MTQAYVPGQNDPHQEPINTDMSYGEAIRAIAERVAFASEDVRNAVYAALDREHNPAAEDDETDDDESEETGASGDGASAPATTDGEPRPVKRAPAKKTAAAAHR